MGLAVGVAVNDGVLGFDELMSAGVVLNDVNIKTKNITKPRVMVIFLNILWLF